MTIEMKDITKIKDLEIGEIVEGLMFIEGFEYRLKKGNETWTTVSLSDGDFSIVGKYWDGKLDLTGKAILKFQGRVGEYNNRLELTLMSVEAIELKDEDLPTKVDIKKYYRNIKVFREYVKDRDFGIILDELFFNRDISDAIYQNPAATNHHHNYRGGLIEHIYEVTATAYYISNAYDNLNRDLIITGALLHDIGKTKVYGIDKLTPTYDELLGMQEHLFIGVEMVKDIVREKNPSMDKEKLNLLLNIIGAHHLRGEWGAIFKPCIKETYIVHYADMISSRMNSFSMAEEPNKNFFNIFSDDMKMNVYTSDGVSEIMSR